MAKLVSQNTNRIGSIEITNDEIKIGRKQDNDVQIIDIKISGYHCNIKKEGKSYILTDESSNGTFLNSTLVGKGVSVKLSNGDEISLLDPEDNSIAESEKLVFVFVDKTIKEISATQVELRKRDAKELEKLKEIIKEKEAEHKHKEEEIKKEKEKQIEQEQHISKLDSKIQGLMDEFTCGICYETLFQPVLVDPCMHNFCGSCLSDWISRSKECPFCRKQMTKISK